MDFKNQYWNGGRNTMNNKLDGLSMDLENANMEKLKSVFPECFAEGKLDIDKLLSLCGEYIDNDFEKYKFEWKGKSECLRLAQKRSTGTLRPCHEESVNFDDTENVYIEGDNLEVLKLLQTAYYNKIKMIYIDPPYNTGNDFVYEDDFADPMSKYKEVTQQTTKSNPETMGRYHTNWLNMMYPRLRLAANLLRDDGVIFISIDDNEIHNLRKLCDEVFGEENLIAELIWDLGTGTTAGHFTRGHEYVVCYAKRKDNISNFENYNHGEIIKHGALKKISYKNPATEITFPIGFEFEGENAEFEGEIGGSEKEYITSGKMIFKNGKLIEPVTIKAGFAMKNQVEDFIAGKEVYDTKGQRVIRFYFNSKGILFYEKEKTIINPRTVLSNIANTKNGTTEVADLFGYKYFDFPKPVPLIQYLIKLITKHADIILDFFSGSATTAHAVMQLNADDEENRKFIMVQLPELCDEKSEAYKAGYKNICDIGKERIRRAGKKILEEKGDQIAIGDEEKKPLDVGFKVFKLDTSNLKLWDNTPITGDDQIEMFTERMNSMIDSIKDDRTDMDVVYEVMLKMGVPLDVPVQYIEVNGKIVYIVGEFLLMIALFDNITAEDIESIAAYAPAKIICAESSFKDDSALSNAHYILRDKQIELKLV